MFLLAKDNNSTIINFLGLKLTVLNFLLIAGGLAILFFLLLLAILLLMYIRKRLAIKGYISYENKNLIWEGKILQIENEISQIQKKLYSSNKNNKEKNMKR